MQFSDGAPDFGSESWVDVDHKLRPVKSNLAVAQTSSAKVGLFVCLFVCLFVFCFFVCSQTPEAVEASPY